MALTINTNMSSLVAQRNLSKATESLNVSIERMTTGYKVNHAADNAAGYSIARNWDTQLSSLDVAADNAATGADMLTTLEDTYALISTHLQRVRDLTEQAANGTYGEDSLQAIKAEIYSRLQEINRIAANCEFNGKKLMDGTAGALNLQVGLYSDNNSKITLSADLFASANMTGLFSSMANTTASGGKKLSEIVANAKAGAVVTDLTIATNLETFACACAGIKYDGTAVTTAGYTPDQMIDFLDKALTNISTKSTSLGAAQNRINSALDSISVQSENITSSLSTLRDADIAEESSNYVRAQILQQAASTLLSTANQTPAIVLNLL